VQININEIKIICDKCGKSLGRGPDQTKMLALWGRLEGESKKDKTDGRTWHYCKACAAKVLEVILRYNKNLQST